MRAALAWMLLASAALAQRPEPGVPPGWAVYVVHASWCAPCQRFRRDYDTIAEFRGPLESAYAVKSCDWERGNDQRFARRHGISRIPGFIVFRDGVHQCSFEGYSGDWRAFCEKLNLDVNGAGTDSADSGTVERPNRPITPVERALPEIADLRAEFDRLRRQMAEAAKPKQPEATAGASPTEKPVRPDIPSGTGTPAQPPVSLPPVLSIPAVEAPAGSGSGVGAQWGKVGLAALTLLAPQFAIPAGAIGVAGTVFQMLRKRRQALQQQPQRQTIIERPIPVAMPAMPQPAQVVTQNQYVPIDTDSTADAYTWATAQLVKQYPGAEGTVAMLGSLIEQHRAASGGRNGNK